MSEHGKRQSKAGKADKGGRAQGQHGQDAGHQQGQHEQPRPQQGGGHAADPRAQQGGGMRPEQQHQAHHPDRHADDQDDARMDWDEGPTRDNNP